MRAEKVVTPSLAPKDPMTGAEYPVGTLINIAEGCCGLPDGEDCCCGEQEPCPHGGQCCLTPHWDTINGCERVEITRFPLDGEIGPFTYDSVNKLPVKNNAATEAFWLGRLNVLQSEKAQLDATKAALVAANKSTTAIDAQITAKQAEITTALSYLP